MNKAKIEKYIEYGQTKLKTYIKEKKHYSNGHRLKYILERNDSDVLVIVFSGFTRIGLKARYNYNHTLKDIKVNKLFILDDFGYDQRGAYYLGHNMDFGIQDCVADLIKYIQGKLGVKKTFYVGSSKGGYAALYFGTGEKNSIIIAGAPQYKLGDFLNRTDYNRENCLKYIVGEEITDEKVELINSLLETRIKKNKNNDSRIHLHYSPHDPHFDYHISHLINELKANGYILELDEKDYKKHTDVSIYFPEFLVSRIEPNL